MAETSIEWTRNEDGTAGKTWNPITGCRKVSPGCAHCYAETIAKRFWKDRPFTEVRTHEDRLEAPLHWRKPQRVFVNSMSDLFHEDVAYQFIDDVFRVMFKCERHTFQVLTKRPERMAEYTSKRWGVFGGKSYPLAPNIWLGVSVEDQQRADQRIPFLLHTPAAVRFLSVEPILGPINLSPYLWQRMGELIDHLHWVIVGGESGPKARPMHPNWPKDIRDQCQAAKLPFFFKQWGEWLPAVEIERNDTRRNHKGAVYISHDGTFTPSSSGTAAPSSYLVMPVGKKAAGRLLDGREWNEFPKGVAIENH